MHHSMRCITYHRQTRDEHKPCIHPACTYVIGWQSMWCTLSHMLWCILHTMEGPGSWEPYMVKLTRKRSIWKKMTCTRSLYRQDHTSGGFPIMFECFWTLDAFLYHKRLWYPLVIILRESLASFGLILSRLVPQTEHTIFPFVEFFVVLIQF